MKRRYAYDVNDNYKKIRIDEKFFNGYACYLKLQNIIQATNRNQSERVYSFKKN